MHQFAATILESTSKALASYAAAELLEQRPAAAEHFNPGAHEAWQKFFQARLDELAAALLVNDAKLFASDMAWAKSLFVVRDVKLDDLRFAFGVMRAVVERELPASVQQCMPTFFELAERELASDSVRMADGINTDTSHGRLAALFLQAILEGERTRACNLILDTVRDGLPIPDVYQSILAPVTREVGRMWHAGEMNVAEEHFATATTELVMSQLYVHMPQRTRLGKTVIVAAAQGNQHGVPVRFIGDFFEMDGWRVIHLGSDMPAPDLAQAVEDFQADLVALSVTMSRHLRATKMCIDAIRQTNRGATVKVMVGGLAVSHSKDIWKNVGADAVADSGAEALAVARSLVGLPPASDRASAS
jgi:methanogenic corrinoid protein MtbC1